MFLVMCLGIERKNIHSELALGKPERKLGGDSLDLFIIRMLFCIERYHLVSLCHTAKDQATDTPACYYKHFCKCINATSWGTDSGVNGLALSRVVSSFPLFIHCQDLRAL